LCAFEDGADVDSDLAVHVRYAGPVTHQSARFGHLAIEIAGRYAVACGQRGKLDAAACEKAIWLQKKGVLALLRNRGESCVDVAAGTGVQHMKLQSEFARRWLDVLQRRVGAGGIARIEQYRDAGGLRDEFVKEPKPLGVEFEEQKIDAGRIAVRAG